MNSLEIADKKAQLIKRNLDLLALAKQEVRELTEEEDQEFKENEEEIQKLDEEQKELDAELEKEEEKEEKSNKNISIDKKMETKKFSLVEEIKRSMETRQPIVLDRAIMSVAGEGEDVVATDVWDVWEPLRQENVLVAAGARLYTGLVGDVQIPIYSGGNVKWKGETAAADEGNGTFSNVTLSPKRITGKFPISLAFIAQTTPDVEAAIRNDIAFALNAKLEETLLGAEAGSATQPAGLFNGLTAESVTDYAELNDVIAGQERLNYKNLGFILSPEAKAAFKGMIKGQNNTGMVYEGGEVDGYKAETTSNVAAKKGLVGDFSQLVMGVWGDIRIDVVADSATLAEGQIMIIVNAFMDGKLGRSNAVVAIDTTV